MPGCSPSYAGALSSLGHGSRYGSTPGDHLQRVGRVTAPVGSTAQAVQLEEQKMRVPKALKLRTLWELHGVLGELHLPFGLFLFNQECHLSGLA